jgi:hypothetical protein
MSDPPIVPDFERCNDVAGALQRMRLPDTLVRQPLPWSDRATVGNFNLILVAICHQTQRISGTVDGQWCRGWDYLERKLEEHSRRNPRFLEMPNLATLSPDELNAAFAPSPQSAVFHDVKERTALITGIGSHMLRGGFWSLQDLCKSVDYRCMGENSIISFLRSTDAYSDPNEKKIRLLIGLLRDAHGWTFKDAHKLGAPIDYHEIRGHLRIGTVVVRDLAIKSRFQSDTLTGNDDLLVRAAISEAVVAITRHLPGHDALQVHYILWNFFRAGCRRHKPVCCDGGHMSRAELDAAYLDSFKSSSTRCLFSSFCESFRKQTFPIEHSYNGNYY